MNAALWRYTHAQHQCRSVERKEQGLIYSRLLDSSLRMLLAPEMDDSRLGQTKLERLFTVRTMIETQA